MKPKNIYDIADKTGVSTSTVSRVINNNPGISAKTREKVLSAMAELNYSPNIGARNLATSRTEHPDRKDCIGAVIAGHINAGFGDIYWSEVFNSVVFTAAENAQKVLPEKMKKEFRTAADLPGIIKDGSVDGLILLDILEEPFINQLKKMEIPFVLLGGGTYNIKNINSITIDNFNGACSAVEYLIEKGHRNIGLILGDPRHNDTTIRFEAYKATLKKYGIEYNDELVEEGDFSFLSGYKAIQNLLAKKTRPTSVFAMNDASALGAHEAIREAGLKIPGDISLVGFDNIYLCEFMKPQLTTVSGNQREIGQLAVKRLLEIIENPKIQPVKYKVSTKLIERESAGIRR
jgi:LacI family transcriptional regulator